MTAALPLAPDLVSTRLKRARLGVFGIFLVVGFLMAVWVVNIPAIQDRTGVSHSVLGSLILLLGLGSFAAMQVTGWLIDRVGSRRTTLLGVVVLIVAANLLGTASAAWMLGVALFVFGLGNGAADVAMNHQAVVLEQRYGRPIMSAFHAFFSLGGAAGALAGAATQALGVGLQLSLLLAGAVAVVLTVVSGPTLLALAEEGRVAPEVTSAGEAAVVVESRPHVGRRVFALASLAFLLMLSEGVANDWSALQAVEHLDQSAAAASLAYGTFAVMMTLGRFGADRIAHAFGPVNVVRYGALVASAGMLVIIASPTYPLTLLGWALFGAGLSGIVPQIFTAAGNVDSARSGVNLSRVVGAGYLGLLAGPALIGWLGDHIGLTPAFVLPFVFCIVGVVLAHQVSGSRRVAADH